MNKDYLGITREFLNGVTAVKEAEENPDPPTETPVDRDGSSEKRQFTGKPLRFRLSIAKRIPPQLCDAYEMSGLSRTAGPKLCKAMIHSGELNLLSYNPPRRGGAIKAPLLTDIGWSNLNYLSIEKPSPVLGGGQEHNFCGGVTGALAKRVKVHPSYEQSVPVGNQQHVRVDIALLEASGQIIYVQCCFSSVPREARNAILLLSSTVVAANRLLLVCRDKKFATELLKTLKPEPLYKQHAQQVAIKIFGELLMHYYSGSTERLW